MGTKLFKSELDNDNINKDLKEDTAKMDFNNLQSTNGYFYKDFIPPGHHHFYFIKGGKQFMLSKKF
jgi:hypothetical protein